MRLLTGFIISIALQVYSPHAMSNENSATSTLSQAATNQTLLERILVLANQGNAEAQYHVGMMYNNGVGGATQDQKSAYTWFQKAANGNDVLGAYKLGCYYAGQFPNVVKVDFELAHHYKLIAAKAGYSLAQLDVGIYYFKKNDFQNAIPWLQAAADQGDLAAASQLSSAYAQLKSPNHAMSYAYSKIAERLYTSALNDAAKKHIEEKRSKLSTDELIQVDRFLEQWKPQPSEISQTAKQGINRIHTLLEN